MANILFARRGFVDDLDDTAQEYIIPVEADRKPRQLRPPAPPTSSTC